MNNKHTYTTIPCDTNKCCVETESFDEIYATTFGKYKACIIRQLSNTKAIVKCLWCNKEFETYFCKIRAGRGKYCSKICLGHANGAARIIDCNGIFTSEMSAGKNNGNWQGGDFIDCEICGKPFWKYPSRNQATCSTACGFERAKLVRIGILPSLNHRGYYNGIKNWKYLRKEALKRDNYTCQKCKLVFKTYTQFLHIHHKIYLSCGGKNELSNLITLCKYCHFALHNQSGDLRKR